MRVGSIERQSKETRVEVRLELDGSGQYDVATDNRFLTHMLETWARYAGFDLRLRASGDLDHHVVEDSAIACGQAFRQAFANAPCTRIAYDFVPMDDALVLCAVDLVDRPYYAGELPIPLFEHWFRSFAMEARINLHFERLRGRDTHHTIEACFKSFGRALRKALEPRSGEVSTKGAVRIRAAKAEGPTAPATSPGVPPAAMPAATPAQRLVDAIAAEAMADVEASQVPKPRRRTTMKKAVDEVTAGPVEPKPTPEFAAAKARADAAAAARKRRGKAA